MTDGHNALAELAEQLSKIRHKTKVPEDGRFVDIARRIVAELAKMDGIKEYTYVAHTVFANEEFVDVFRKCRAIAEEGAEDGK